MKAQALLFRVAIQSLALLTLALPWSAPTHASQPLESEIEKRISRVPEFEFIRKEAEKLGVRAWLFGGTAAGYAHYVNWDTKRENGDTRFHPLRFDYDYTNIYRANQDLDIVVDGTPEQAQALQARLAETYPHLQGNKSAWEVRLLKHSLGIPGQPGWKEALLKNSDFLNQHTDSNSTGMIEITRAPPGEPAIRDVRDWDSKDPFFLKDVRDGKLHYYFSELHGSTVRAKSGINPPILSVIRYLTKAFQYDLKVRPEDLATIRKIINEFDPNSPGNETVRNWIEKNGKKLVQNAVNLENAFNQMDALGIRKKLIAITNNARSENSLAWWLSREPLRTHPVGIDPKTGKQSSGKTAKELKISVVAHETMDFEAYESITRDHTGEPNVLISRQDAQGEAALYGNGFYTQIGREGARGSKITIRFNLDPNAREGVDFKRSGSYIIVQNRAALRVIPESLNMTPVEYFGFLATGKGVVDSDRGALEKLRRRTHHQYQNLSDDDYRKIAEIVENQLNTHPADATPSYAEWKSLPRQKDFANLKINERILRKTLKRIESLPNDKQTSFKSLMLDLFQSPPMHGSEELMKQFIKASYSQDAIRFIEQVLSQPGIKNGEALLLEILKRDHSLFVSPYEIDRAIIKLFQLPHTRNWTAAMMRFVQQSIGSTFGRFADQVLSLPDVKDGELLFQAGMPKRSLVHYTDKWEFDQTIEKLLSLPHAQNWKKEPEMTFRSCIAGYLKNLFSY